MFGTKTYSLIMFYNVTFLIIQILNILNFNVCIHFLGMVARLNDTSCLVLCLFVYVSASFAPCASAYFIIGL